MAHNHERTDAVSVWKGDATAEKGDCRGNRNDNRGIIRVAFCKKCDKRTKVRFVQTGQNNHEGYPLVKAICLSEGCGNDWMFADRYAKGEMPLMDAIKVKGNTKSKSVLAFAQRNGLIGDRRVDAWLDAKHEAWEQDMAISHNQMITIDRHPPTQHNRNTDTDDFAQAITIKCAKCGCERKTTYKIYNYACPECNGHHYKYLMLNGEYQ